MNFFEFLSTEFTACSKLLAEIIIVKHFIQRLNNATRVQVEPSLYDQGHQKKQQCLYPLGHTANILSFMPLSPALIVRLNYILAGAPLPVTKISEWYVRGLHLFLQIQNF